MKPFALFSAAAAALILAPGRAGAESLTQVDVVVDFSPAGQKVAHPDPAHPAFYVPVMGKFQELGSRVAGEAAPDPHEVARVVAVELAKQGYLGVVAAADARGHLSFSRKPSLLLSVQWGCLNPASDEDPSGPPTIYNRGEMLALVGGNRPAPLQLDREREDVMQAAEEDRYFVALRAYDFDAYAGGKKVLLWEAKMSLPSSHLARFGDALVALVKAGAPFFGRETTRPKMLFVPLTPEGQVKVGAPEVKDYLDAPVPPPPAKK